MSVPMFTRDLHTPSITFSPPSFFTPKLLWGITKLATLALSITQIVASFFYYSPWVGLLAIATAIHSCFYILPREPKVHLAAGAALGAVLNTFSVFFSQQDMIVGLLGVNIGMIHNAIFL